MIPPIYYKVDGKIIFNDLLAKYESYRSGKRVEFYCHTDEYDTLDWSKEPTESMRELIDRHSQFLRSKYGYIVLCWSGGTDSQAIYESFMRCNLLIDEIVYWRGGDVEPWYSDYPITWLRENHKDPRTKITIRDRFDPDAKRQVIKNEDWIWENRTLIPKFVLNMYDSLVDDCEESYGHSTYVIINGHEQPRVFEKDGKYWSTQSNVCYLSVLGAPNVHCFFAEPLLTLKQSHILKRIHKGMIRSGKFTKEDRDLYRRYDEAVIDNRAILMKNRNDEAYTAWQLALGRSKDVVKGNSFLQKVSENPYENVPVTIDAIDGELSRSYDKGLDSLLAKDDDLGKMFERGIKNLLLERDFCRYLDERRKDKSISLIGKKTGYIVHSKSYCLGS